MKKGVTYALVCCLGLLVQCSEPPAPATPPRPEPPALPPNFCYLETEAPTVRVDMKYAGCDNFVGRPIDGYLANRAILRRDAAQALRKAADALAKQGYGLLVWDAYRPARALRDFRAWSRTADDHTKAEFYPNLTKQGIYAGRYIGDTSEHTWGIAVDLTLVHLDTGEMVDMGGRHDLLDPSSATHSPQVTPAQRANRLRLNAAMRAAGFSNYPKEWWHYRLSNSAPWRVYNFPVQ